MGLANKVTTSATTTKTVDSTLTPREYEFLFGLIKNSTFKGEDLETLYNITVKLQAQYFQINNT
jgi:hypothetical protein